MVNDWQKQLPNKNCKIKVQHYFFLNIFLKLILQVLSGLSLWNILCET